MTSHTNIALPQLIKGPLLIMDDPNTIPNSSIGMCSFIGTDMTLTPANLPTPWSTQKDNLPFLFSDPCL